MLKKAFLTLFIVTLFVGAATAATSICPFDTPTPSKLPQGHYIVSKQTVGTGDGAMVTSEGTTFTGGGLTNSYEFAAQATGSTSYASTLSTDVDTITSEKAIDQGNVGLAAIEEGYFQMNVNRSDNLTINDLAAGGSYTVMSPGQFASMTTLNRPVNLVYQVAVGGPDSNNGMASGYSVTWLSVLGQEGYGNNGTYNMTAQQTTHQSVAWFGNFQYATQDSVRITHPFAQVGNSLTSLSQFTCR